MCAPSPRPRSPVSSPHRTECVDYRWLHVWSRRGDGVQCRQKKLGCCFHRGGDTGDCWVWPSIRRKRTTGPFGLDGGMVKLEL